MDATAQALSFGTEDRLLALADLGLAQHMGSQYGAIRRRWEQAQARLENRVLQAILLNRIKRVFPMLSDPAAVNAMLTKYRGGYRSGRLSTLMLASQPARTLPP